MLTVEVSEADEGEWSWFCDACSAEGPDPAATQFTASWLAVEHVKDEHRDEGGLVTLQLSVLVMKVPAR